MRGHDFVLRGGRHEIVAYCADWASLGYVASMQKKLGMMLTPIIRMSLITDHRKTTQTTTPQSMTQTMSKKASKKTFQDEYLW